MNIEKRVLGPAGFKATVPGIGDLADRWVPLEQCVATIHRSMQQPRRHKGADPEDERSFDVSRPPDLWQAVHDVCWLLDYS